MASTMESNEIMIHDRVPGVIHWGELPRSGITGGTHHNIAGTGADEYPYQAGYKIGVFDRINQGNSILAYLKYVAGDVACAAGHICLPESGSAWYQVTNDGAGGVIGVENTYMAVALSAMTDGYWGWFWVGGVCPEEHVTALASVQLITESSVVVGGAKALIGDTANRIAVGLINAAGDQALCYALVASDA